MWQMVRLTHRNRDCEELQNQLKQTEIDRGNFRRQHLERFHRTLHQVRDTTYSYLFETKNSSSAALLLSEACKKLTSGVRELYISHFASRGFAVGEAITITLKLRAKAGTAKLLLDHDARAEPCNANFPDNEWCLITLARDDHADRRREITRHLYSQTANAAFHAIVGGNKNHYTCNSLSGEPNYSNENREWKEFYNATQAVPIRYVTLNGASEIFGILCVDSPNIADEPLFDPVETFHVAAFGADLAALVLHNHVTAAGFIHQSHPPAESFSKLPGPSTTVTAPKLTTP
jgi:hypothetical protein